MTKSSISSPGSATLAAPFPCRGGWEDSVQMVRRVTHRTADTFLGARPSDFSAEFPEQVRSAYRNLFQNMGEGGWRGDEFLAEKVFLSDIRSQLPACRAGRDQFYRFLDLPADRQPALTYIQQPPARPGQLCEIRIHGVGAPGDSPGGDRRAIAPEGTGKVIEVNGLQYLQLAGEFGGSPGDDLEPHVQVGELFRRAAARLRREGMSFRDVVRTWLYLPDIDATYDALNRARSEFFRHQGIHPPPASTGIQGIPYPPDRACSLDLLAIRGEEYPKTARMYCPTMNEAPDYGSAFSRGTVVEMGDRSILFLSGTASIDTGGQVAHLGDVAGQTNRMLLNIEALLEAQGATFEHLVSVITYLKRKEDLETVQHGFRAWNFPEQIPHTFCVADVCRPEWLIETEVTAILDR